MAQYRLPFSFNVVSKVPAKRKRALVEQDGGPLTPERPAVRRRVDDANITAQINPPINEQTHHPASDTDYPDGPEVGGGSTSSSPPLVPPFIPSRSAGSSSAPLNATRPPDQAVAPPRTDGEPTPTLTEVNPEQGSITGGARIWLKGIDFPALFPLFARFGTAVVPTVSLRDERCKHRLTNFLRSSPLAHFLPAICPPQVCQVASMLRYRSTPSQMRRSMDAVSRSFNI